MRIAIGLAAAAAAFAATAVPANALTFVGDQGTVWIYGEDYRQSSAFCFSAAERKYPAKLQLRDSRGKWTTVSTTKRYVKDRSCIEDFGKKMPYTVVYSFTVTELGEPMGGDKYRIQAREVLRDDSENFTKTVYPSKQAHAQALLDSFTDLLGGS